MNKSVSLAIEKAVDSLSQKNQNELKNNGPKKPDLFSLSGETELFQNEKGITIKIDRSRDANLTDFGRATLTDRYLGQNESFQDLFARVASVYADDNLHAQRIYNYISNLWFMPATPVLSNGGTERGLPISCFLNEASDSLGGILDLWSENVWLAANQTFSLHKSRMPPKLSEASFKKHEIGNPLFVPPFDKTGVAGMNQRLLM